MTKVDITKYLVSKMEVKQYQNYEWVFNNIWWHKSDQYLRLTNLGMALMTKVFDSYEFELKKASELSGSDYIALVKMNSMYYLQNTKGKCIITIFDQNIATMVPLYDGFKNYLNAL